MDLGEPTRKIIEQMPLESLALQWEAERVECEADARQLAGRRAANREREKILIARLAGRGGFVEVPGWVLTVAADGHGLQRTRVDPARGEGPPR